MPTIAINIQFDDPYVKDLVALLGSDLCKERGLPSELAVLIAHHFDAEAILAISTLTKSLRERANAILYHNIVIDPSSSTQFKQSIILLLRTLVTSRTATSHIRRLSLTGEPLKAWRRATIFALKLESEEKALITHPVERMSFDLSVFTRQEIDQYISKVASHRTLNQTSITELTLPWLCIDLITMAVDLQDLFIESDYFRWLEFQAALKSMVRSGRLQSLQSSNFCRDLARGVYRHLKALEQNWDDALLVPFSAPNIDSITTALILGQKDSIELQPSAVTRLCLDHYQVQPFDLHRLFTAMPKLWYLKYDAWIDWTYYPSPYWPDDLSKAGLEPLFDALDHVKDTLTELDATITWTEDSSHFDDYLISGYKPLFTQSKGFTQLKHLHTISVPLVFLLGDEQKHTPVRDWDLILPASLRRITWNDDLVDTLDKDDWTDDMLIPVITSLLDWLRKTKQPDEIAEFGLLIRHLSEQFNEPVRQEISQLCQDRGISCSIRKTKPDRPKPPPRTEPTRGRGRGGGGAGRGDGSSRGGRGRGG